MLLRGVGTLRFVSPPNASVQWQPDGLTIHTKKWFLEAGFLGAPPISLKDRRGSTKTVSSLKSLENWLPQFPTSDASETEIKNKTSCSYIYIYIYIYIHTCIHIYVC